MGESSGGFEDTHGGHGYGIRNSDGVRMLDFCVANRLAIANTFFKKKHSRLITYSSGGAYTQIDFLVVKRSNLRHVKNVNVVRTEECISQHKLLIGDIMLSTKPRKPSRLPPRLKLWRLKDVDIQSSFANDVRLKCQEVPEGVNDAWNHLKTALLEAAKENCGSTKGGVCRHKET